LIDEIECRPDRTDGGDAGRFSALDHHDLDAELSRGPDLGVRCRPAGILGDDHVDPVGFQQACFVIDIERPAGQQVAAVGNVKRRIDGVDAAYEIGMLRRVGEVAGLLATDGEEDAPRRRSEHVDCGIHVRNPGPPVCGFRRPLRTAQRKDGYTRSLGRLRGVRGDAIGKGMGGVHKQVDIFFSQVISQSLDAAEAADSRRQGQGFGVDRPSGKRYGGVETAALGDSFGQRARLRRAAEDENVGIAHG